MTAKKPQLAPRVPKPAALPPPPPRVQPTTCTTCDAMQRKMLRMEQALRVISTWAACDADSPHPRYQAMRDIERKCYHAILGS